MSNDEAWTIGQRVRRIRRRRGMGLAVAAGLAGISKPYLSMLERGERGFNRRGLLEDLARALSCSVADLTGQPYHLTDRDTEDAFATLPGIQLALNDYGPDDAPDVDMRPLDELVARADAAELQWDQARVSHAGKDIGSLVTELQAHAGTATGSDRERAYVALVTACKVSGAVAKNVGNIDLSVSAFQRGYDLARRSEDPSLIGFAQWDWALSLLRLGARRRAKATLAAGIDELAPRIRTRSGPTLPGEVAGLMHLASAQTAARDRRSDDAHTHLAAAADLADRLGERNGMRQHFGPTNVAIWRLGIGVELGEGGAAYAQVMHTPIDSQALGSPERSSSMHLDCARALVQDGRTRDDVALRHLDTADRLAPQRIRMDPLARDLVLTLDRRAPRRSWELDSLRNRFGLGKG
ncbi:MAG: helix-turn-helix domain-containing protein [Pseudonocardiaceae bacterium]